jgi:hypothetical protein
MFTCSFAVRIDVVDKEQVRFNIIDKISFNESRTYLTCDGETDVHCFFVKNNQRYPIFLAGEKIRHVTKRLVSGFVSFFSFRLSSRQFRLADAASILSPGETIFIRSNLLE